MPLFTKAEIVGGLALGARNPWDKFASELPSGQMMQGQIVSQSYRQAIDRLPAAQMMNWGQSTQGAVARTATRVGIADYDLRATPQAVLGELGKALEIDVFSFTNADVLRASAGELLTDAALWTFNQAIDMIATKVPIAGWIAQAALFLVDIIKLAFEEVQEDPPPPTVEALMYEQADDATETENRLRELSAAESLTYYFMPWVSPSTVSARRADTARGPYGVIATVEGPRRTAWGHVPGTPFVGDFVQYSERATNGGVAVGRGTVTGYAGLHPSVSQLSLMLWQMVTRNGPDAFRIDGERIGREWDDWYRVLNDWALSGDPATTEGQHRWSMVSQLSTWAQLRYPKRAGGGEVIPRIDRYFPEGGDIGGGYAAQQCPGGKICVPMEYVQWRGQLTPDRKAPTQMYASYGGFVRYIVEREWRSALTGYLQTLTCAYVPPSAAALQADSALAELHDDMRRLLPTRSAVDLVDVSMIPDAAYRSQIQEAQRRAGGGTLKQAEDEQKILPLAIRKAVGNAPAISPEALVDAAPTFIDVVPALPPRPGGGAGALGAIALGAVGLGGVAYAMRRRRRR